MAAKESVSITYYVGVINVILAAVWAAVYVFGVIGDSSITSPTATPFYVGTLFAVGFGLVFPSFEKTMAGKTKINTGIFMSVVALGTYAGLVAIYFLRGSLVMYDLTQLF
ncbi:MAG: hypothetical protein H6839_11665 [Planctomycetes bacterium]|nr:hypothetical protein [Planctomycetota bacterium]